MGRRERTIAEPLRQRKGSASFFQLMPATAKAYGLDPTDPLQNAMGAARLDAELLKRYRGDLTEALAAYNWNPTGVDAEIAKGKKTGKD
jgi:hypothetical protein